MLQIGSITKNRKYLETGELSPRQKQTLGKIHKGEADQYIRLAELIVKRKPKLTESDVLRWRNKGATRD